MWLMENSGLTKNAAYDQARKEFYALRQEEEIERRVAREEARHVGAYFGKTRLEVSMDIEDQEYERWKAWAAIQVEARANTTSEITFDVEPVEEELPEPEATEPAR
jgi:small subunit ribosomal protein S23